MLVPLAGMLLLLLLLGLYSTAAESQGGTEMPHRLEQILASPGDTVEILCRRPARVYMHSVTWYKEGQDRALSKIYETSSFSRPQGRYSGKKYAGENFNLTISRLQKNDSGVYYCVALIGGSFRVINGSRVIITGGAKPTPAILGPSSLEGAPLNHSSPLLCLIWDADPAWAFVFWNIGGAAASQDPWTGNAIDGGGVFGLWSLQLVPPESWAPGASYTCSVPGSRNVSAAFLWGAETPHTGNCVHLLYWGVLPCTLILLLLITLLVLLIRKMLARGNTAHLEAPVRRRETPETEYAALGCRQGKAFRRIATAGGQTGASLGEGKSHEEPAGV